MLLSVGGADSGTATTPKMLGHVARVSEIPKELRFFAPCSWLIGALLNRHLARYCVVQWHN